MNLNVNMSLLCQESEVTRQHPSQPRIHNAKRLKSHPITPLVFYIFEQQRSIIVNKNVKLESTDILRYIRIKKHYGYSNKEVWFMLTQTPESPYQQPKSAHGSKD